MEATSTQRRVRWPRLRPHHRALTLATALTLAVLVLAPQAGMESAASTTCALAPGEGFDEGPAHSDELRPRGVQRSVMIMVDFPDRPARGSAARRAGFFSRHSDRYFARASDGRFRLRLSPTRDWVRMPQRWSSYGVARGAPTPVMRHYVEDAIKAARRAGTDFTGARSVFVVADDNVPAAPTVSQANTFTGLRAGSTPLQAAALVFGRAKDDPDWQRGNFVHEAHHFFGLPDLYDIRRGASARYAGGWDTMSLAGVSDLLGWHKRKLGWLPDSQVDCVAEPGTSGHTLRAVGTGAGARIVVVRTGRHTALVAEARTRTGLDSGICSEGVLLYSVDSRTPTGHGPVRLVDAHPASRGAWGCPERGPTELAELSDAPFTPGTGHTFADHGVRVTVTERLGQGYRVRVTRGEDTAETAGGRTPA
ncbi:peptidase M6 [Streptomyces sp. NPDC005438]|uniref:peptidase M6 n=1 Tax=Streptomyces sp. NPDC005438 TaxID=3156880 RepID=UPI00339EE686